MSVRPRVLRLLLSRPLRAEFRSDTDKEVPKHPRTSLDPNDIRAGVTCAPSSSAMPSILNDEDKETVKRFVPKQTNKIQAVAVARLYVAYPDRSRWTYTGLQGAVVIANDLVGNTYWVKLVDISVRQPPRGLS